MGDLLQLSERLREIAAAAAVGVGDQLRAAFRSPEMQTSYKRDAHDVVTVHDTRAEHAITDMVLDRWPDSTIVGEEGGHVGSGAVEWHVDPIDGTSNFARGISFWCTSIGAVVDGAVCAGAVYDPVEDHLFEADLTGAHLDGRRLTPPHHRGESDATLISSYPPPECLDPGAEEHLAVRARLQRAFSSVRDLGSSALALAHVAAGWTDATFGVGSHTWDLAAGQLLVTQAGGSYVGWLDGEQIRDRTAFRAPQYLAVGGEWEYPTLTDAAIQASGIAAQQE